MAWMIFSVTILAFPTAPAPDAEGMNYMIVVFGAWIALCLVYYRIPVYGGACWFNGPRVTVDEPNIGNSRASSAAGRSKGSDGVEVVAEDSASTPEKA